MTIKLDQLNEAAGLAKILDNDRRVLSSLENGAEPVTVRIYDAAVAITKAEAVALLRSAIERTERRLRVLGVVL